MGSIFVWQLEQRSRWTKSPQSLEEKNKTKKITQSRRAVIQLYPSVPAKLSTNGNRDCLKEEETAGEQSSIILPVAFLNCSDDIDNLDSIALECVSIEFTPRRAFPFNGTRLSKLRPAAACCGLLRPATTRCWFPAAAFNWWPQHRAIRSLVSTFQRWTSSHLPSTPSTETRSPRSSVDSLEEYNRHLHPLPSHPR